LYLGAGRSEWPVSIDGLSNGVYMVQIQFMDQQKSVTTRHKVIISN
jgi:hypothetical protein